MEGDGHLVSQEVSGIVLWACLKGKMKYSNLYLEAATGDCVQVLQRAAESQHESEMRVYVETDVTYWELNNWNY